MLRTHRDPKPCRVNLGPAMKETKIRRALKSAARLPQVLAIRVGRGSSRNQLSPAPGKPPVVIQVIGCMNLSAKYCGGASDP